MKDGKRILIFQGSPRREDNCPNQNGKTHQLAQYICDHIPTGVTVDLVDLSVGATPSNIQPCKGCISTAGGYHCHWPCDCYSRNSTEKPDFMHDYDVYGRLKACDGFLVLTPIHWYAATTVVKSMFDRLVCASLTLTVEQSRALGLGKDATKTRAAEKAGTHDHLLTNHLEGKVGAFFAHGDSGGADYREFVKNERGTMPRMPASLRHHARTADVPEGKDNDPREALMPLVWQCRYAGIEVPDDLVGGVHINVGLNYAEAMDRTPTQRTFFDSGMAIFLKLLQHIRQDRGAGSSGLQRSVELAPSASASGSNVMKSL